MHRHHPAFEREIRPRLQSGGEAARGADGAAAGRAVARGDPPDISSRFAAGEVRPSGARLFLRILLRFQSKFLV